MSGQACNPTIPGRDRTKEENRNRFIGNGIPMLLKLQNLPFTGMENLTADALGAITVAVVIVLASMLTGGILYIVIRDALKRNIRSD
jgi:hypothetical protein